MIDLPTSGFDNHKKAKSIVFQTNSINFTKYIFNVDNYYQTLTSDDLKTILSFNKKTSQPNVINNIQTFTSNNEVFYDNSSTVFYFIYRSSLPSRGGDPASSGDMDWVCRLARVLVLKLGGTLKVFFRRGRTKSKNILIWRSFLDIRTVLGRKFGLILGICATGMINIGR